MDEKRKTLILIALAGVILYFGGNFFMQTYIDEPLKKKRSEKENLEKKLRTKKKEVALSKQSVRKLATAEQLSLPSDPEIARSLYRAWLLELVQSAEFQTAHVDSGSASSRKGFYDAIGFSVRGKGTLHQVVRFLYDFYHAGHLHKIQSMNLTPLGKGGGLDVMISIEALILPGTDRKDELSKLYAQRLAYPSVSDYTAVAQRNLFGIGGEADESRQAFLTAVTRDGSDPEVWITVRGQDKLLKLHQGSRFEIGHFSGTVVDILEDDVILESFGERWMLSIGEPLAEAMALPAEF